MRKITLLIALLFVATACASLNITDSTSMHKVTFPKSIKPGDKVGIVAPASAINPAYVDSMAGELTAWGYVPVISEIAKGAHGTYSAPDSIRAAEINKMFADPEIKAIISTRGGHGSIHLIPYLNMELIEANPKWFIGFSDITVMHAILAKAKMASIHGPMKDIAGKLSEECVAAEKQILEKGLPITFEFPAASYNQHGTASGRLYGGNLITFNELAETPYDFFSPGFDSDEGMILFIEEISENVYAVERLLARLHMAGKLAKVNGMIFGQFTACKGDADFENTEQMLRRRLKEWGYLNQASNMPIVFEIPVGHEWPNYPMVEGSFATLESTPDGVKLTMAE